MTVVLCVFKESEEFWPEHVNRLYRMVERNTSVPFKFYVLTNSKAEFIRNVNAISLLNQNLDAKYCKLELFRPDVLELGERFFYADLDTVITGNIDNFMDRDESLVMLEDFYFRGRGASGLMGWTKKLGDGLYHKFKALPTQEREGKYQIGKGNGDQKFIRENAGVPITFWQDIFPGDVISYKVHVRDARKSAGEAKIVCFHGKPKIQDIHEEWIVKEWR